MKKKKKESAVALCCIWFLLRSGSITKLYVRLFHLFPYQLASQTLDKFSPNPKFTEKQAKHQSLFIKWGFQYLSVNLLIFQNLINPYCRSSKIVDSSQQPFIPKKKHISQKSG